MSGRIFISQLGREEYILVYAMTLFIYLWQNFMMSVRKMFHKEGSCMSVCIQWTFLVCLWNDAPGFHFVTGTSLDFCCSSGFAFLVKWALIFAPGCSELTYSPASASVPWHHGVCRRFCLCFCLILVFQTHSVAHGMQNSTHREVVLIPPYTDQKMLSWVCLPPRGAGPGNVSQVWPCVM